MGNGAGKKEKEEEEKQAPKLNLKDIYRQAKVIDTFKIQQQARDDAKNTLGDLPPAAPQKIKKGTIFNAKNYPEAHSRAKSVGVDELMNYQKFLDHLTSDAKDGVEAAWTLYVWMCYYLKVDSPEYKLLSQGDSPLSSIRGVSTGKSDLCLMYKNLCKKIKMDCYLAKGYIKNESFEIGMTQKEASKCKTHWLFILVKGLWMYVNPVLGSKASAKLKEFYFLAEARDHNQFCFPEEPRWQLQERPFKWEAFAQTPLCTPDFFGLGLFIAKPRHGEVNNGDATVRIEISVPTEMAERVILHHKLTGAKVTPYVEKEDTISNDSMPMSPYGSQMNIKTLFTKDAANVMGNLLGAAKKKIDLKNLQLKNNVQNAAAASKESAVNGDVKVSDGDGALVSNDKTGTQNETLKTEPDSTGENDNNKVLSNNFAAKLRQAGVSKVEDKKIVANGVKKVSSPTKVSQSGIHIDFNEFPKHLERYAYLYYGYSRFIYEVDLPIGGEYFFDILGDFVDFSQPSPNVRKLPRICRFKLTKDGMPFVAPPMSPIVPEIGWGPNPYMVRYGLKALSHQDGRIVVDSTDEFTVQFEIFGNNGFHDLKLQTRLRSSDKKPEELEKRTRQVILGDSLYVRVTIPEEGSYALKVFAKKKGEQGFKNVCNYMVVFGNPNIKNPFGEAKDNKYSSRMLRERLQRAIMYSNEKELCKALDNFKAHAIPDEGELELTHKRLQFFDLQKELKTARERRHLPTLNDVIAKAKDSDFAPELRNDIAEAENVYGTQAKNEGYQHRPMHLNKASVVEIRSYNRPKPVIFDTMRAVCILLGEDPNYHHSWDGINALLWKTGKEALHIKVKKLDTFKIPVERVTEAKELIDLHDEKECREASIGILAFYKWAKQICNKKTSSITAAKEQAAKKKTKDTMKRAIDILALTNVKGKP